MTMNWNKLILTGIFTAVIVTVVTVTQAFDPKLNVISCTREKLTVKVSNATDGGIIYIQGEGESCKQVTSSGKELYEFEFSSCNIEWDILFRIVLQKNAKLQTGHDKRIPIFCIADTSNIVAGNFIGAGDKKDDTGQNKTTKPVAKMKFYKQVADQEVSGSEVRLGDTLVISIQLEDKYTGDFDIKARHCIASDIVIVEDYCTPDTGLFPNFYKFKQGHVLNEFSAFRSTDISGATVTMNFSCVLELCQNFCQPDPCGDIYDGWGRKKRSSRRPKRNTGDTIDVGGYVHVVEDYSKIRVITNNDFCWEFLYFVTLIIALVSPLMASTVGCIIMYRKLRALQLRLVPGDRRKN